MERSIEDAATAPARKTRHLPVVTALWVRRFGQVVLAALVVAGVAMPKPGYNAWGILLLGGLLAWLVWLLERLVWRHGQLPGHWMHLGLLAPALILAGHLVAGRLAGGKSGSPSDGMTSSLMIHAALLSLVVVLTQSFCAARGAGRIVSSVVGAAMMAFAVIGLVSQAMDPLWPSLWLMGAAGVGVWLWPVAGAWKRSRRWLGLQRATTAGRVAVAAVGGTALLATVPGWFAPTLAVALAAAVALVALARRQSWRLAGLVAAAMVLGVGGLLAWRGLRPLGLIGRGDQGFTVVTGRDGGLAILAATTGWLGAALMFIAVGGAATWILIRSPREHRRLWATPLAVLTALLATAAFWSDGGYVSPSVGIGMAFAWGMLPAVTGVRGRPRGGWWMAAAVLAIMVALDVASDPGLLTRASKAIGLSDKGMHAVAGFMLAVVLAWWLGSWRWWAGLAMLVVAGLAGEAGEFVQNYTDRSVDPADVWAHVTGVVIAGGIYLLCIMARWAEGSGRGRKPWDPPPLWTYLGAALRLMLTCLLVLLISAWCVAAAITEVDRRRQRSAWFVITDGVVGVPRKKVLHVPGTASRPDLADVVTTYAVGADGVVTKRRQTAHKGIVRAYGRSTTVHAGWNDIWSAGRPLGSLAYQKRRTRWYGVTSRQRVAAIPASTFTAWQQRRPDVLRRLIAALQKRGPVVVLDAGEPETYPKRRKELAEAFPDVVCMNHLPVTNGHPARPIGLLRNLLRRRKGQPRQQPVDFITTDRDEGDLARKIFAGSATVHIVSPEVPAANAWRKAYPRLEALVDTLTAE
ncbi:MAG: hypothetical protein GVY16_05575 [Planctomycetes bacterium]|nr:hypothetical protein [Planctomycetota bacterium]